MKRALLAVLLCALFASACNYAKRGMYIRINNQSGLTLTNLEVDYPGGIFGVHDLADDHTYRHWAPVNAPCKFTLRFDDRSGHQQTSEFSLGQACPAEVEFVLNRAGSFESRLVSR